MYAHAGIVLGVMVAVFALARVFKISTELSMLAAAIGRSHRPRSLDPRSPDRRWSVHLLRCDAHLHHRDVLHESGEALRRRQPDPSGNHPTVPPPQSAHAAVLGPRHAHSGGVHRRGQRHGAGHGRHGGDDPHLHGHSRGPRRSDHLPLRRDERGGSADQPLGDDGGRRVQHAVRGVLPAPRHRVGPRVRVQHVLPWVEGHAGRTQQDHGRAARGPEGDARVEGDAALRRAHRADLRRASLALVDADTRLAPHVPHRGGRCGPRQSRSLAAIQDRARDRGTSSAPHRRDGRGGNPRPDHGPLGRPRPHLAWRRDAAPDGHLRVAVADLAVLGRSRPIRRRPAARSSPDPACST